MNSIHRNGIHRMALVMLTALLLIGMIAGQSRTKPKPKPQPTPSPTPAKAPVAAKRSVTVNLKQGDPVTGLFLRADAETVEVEVKSGRLVIKMNEVASLVFTAEGAAAVKPSEPPATEASVKENPPAVPDPQLPIARKAYATLRKLADAAQIGLPYSQYGSLLIEVKASLEEFLPTLPEGAIKSEITGALEAYKDAGQAWGTVHNKGALLIATEPAATLMKKYSIKPSVNAVGDADHLQLDTALSKIWAAAGAHLNSLAVLIEQ